MLREIRGIKGYKGALWDKKGKKRGKFIVLWKEWHGRQKNNAQQKWMPTKTIK